jgi:uncharacterized protein (TIGR03435 family)
VKRSFPVGNIRGLTSIIDFGGGSRFSFAENALDAKKLNMDEFTEWLSNFMDRPVINNTGLKGYYDFHMNLSTQDFQTMWIWAAMAGGAEVPPQLIPRGDGLSLDSVVNSMKDVGLQLERGKGPVDILVVDSVQRKPTEN